MKVKVTDMEKIEWNKVLPGTPVRAKSGGEWRYGFFCRFAPPMGCDPAFIVIDFVDTDQEIRLVQECDRFVLPNTSVWVVESVTDWALLDMYTNIRYRLIPNEDWRYGQFIGLSILEPDVLEPDVNFVWRILSQDENGVIYNKYLCAPAVVDQITGISYLLYGGLEAEIFPVARIEPTDWTRIPRESEVMFKRSPEHVLEKGKLCTVVVNSDVWHGQIGEGTGYAVVSDVFGICHSIRGVRTDYKLRIHPNQLRLFVNETKPTDWRNVKEGTPVLFRRSKDSEYEEAKWCGGYAIYGADSGAFCWALADVSGLLFRDIGARVDPETGEWHIDPFWGKLL